MSGCEMEREKTITNDGGLGCSERNDGLLDAFLMP
jgi:hypothetical protein